jgi:predicted O-linked N-acetylglucosamine transferase (SPINDLY family)
MATETPIQRALRDAREGRLDAAIASLRFLVQRQPSNLDAVQAFALLLTQAGQQAQAVHQLSRAVALAPKVPAYRNNYANALMGVQRHADAAEQCRKAVEIDPRYERAWLGLALALTQLGDVDGAITACERGRALRPAWPELARAHANALEAADRIEESIEVLAAAVAASPADAELRSRLLLALNYASCPAGEIAAAHRAYHAAMSALPSASVSAAEMRPSSMSATPDRDPARPLRIGVLSADLRTHSVGYFAEPWIAAKPADVSLIAFHTNPPNPADPMEKRFRGLFDHWVEATMLDDAALDRAIREARVDILVELSAHTAGGRLTALSRKPAPVIVSAIGYPNSSGHPAVDYRLVDSTTDPSANPTTGDTGADDLATERLLRLDPCFLCYRPPADATEPVLPAADAPITFGSFNLSTKISSDTIALWSAAMAAVPGSRLLVKSKALGGDVARRHFLQRLASGGIAPERVEIAGYTKGIDEHLALYGRVHVALDTTPYNGTTTTCEALWMGVPVVTIAGDRHAARVGASLLAAAGLPELVARNADEFAEIAARLATDGARISGFRATLRGRVAASPLADSARYAARFHAALRSAWRERCART